MSTLPESTDKQNWADIPDWACNEETLALKKAEEERAAQKLKPEVEQAKEEEKKPYDGPTPDMNRHMRRRNKSRKVQKKIRKIFAKKMPGMNMDNIKGDIIIDGVILKR